MLNWESTRPVHSAFNSDTCNTGHNNMSNSSNAFYLWTLLADWSIGSWWRAHQPLWYYLPLTVVVMKCPLYSCSAGYSAVGWIVKLKQIMKITLEVFTFGLLQQVTLFKAKRHFNWHFRALCCTFESTLPKDLCMSGELYYQCKVFKLSWANIYSFKRLTWLVKCNKILFKKT